MEGDLEQLTYGAFSADLHGRQAGERVPLQVSIEVTRRCPLECLHCYNNLPMDDMDARRRELSKEEHFRVLDELVEMGCFWILYTGGEIFARKDFLEIYTYAKKKGFLITLFTNGTIIDGGDRRLSRGVASVRHRDHALRTHAEDVRGADGDSGLVRPLPARHPAAEGTRAAAEVEDRSDQHQQARSCGDAALRRRRTGRRIQDGRARSTRASIARRARWRCG